MANTTYLKIAFSAAFLLFSGRAFAEPTVSWDVALKSAAANIPLGGVASLLTIMALLISGRYLFPHIKSHRLKSFFVVALLGGMLALLSVDRLFSNVEAAGTSATLSISTATGIENLDVQSTTIRNDYLQTVLLKFNPDHCVLGGSCRDGALAVGDFCEAILDCSCPVTNFDDLTTDTSEAAALYARFKAGGFDNAALSASATAELDALLYLNYGENELVDDPGNYASIIQYWQSNPLDPVLFGDGGFGHAALTLAYLDGLLSSGASDATIIIEADKQIARWYAREARARCNDSVENWLDPQAWYQDSRLDYWTPRKFVELFISQLPYLRAADATNR